MKRVFALKAGLLVALTCGCGGARTNLVQTGAVSVWIVPTRRVYVSSVDAHRVGETFVVSGVVKARFDQDTQLGGHVDVAVVGPDRKLLDASGVPYSPKNLFGSARGKRDPSFEARFGRVPPQGSRVYAAYHGASLSRKPGGADCSANAAFPIPAPSVPSM